MDSEIDLPRRIVPSQPVKPMDPIERKRHDKEHEKPAADDEPHTSEEDAEEQQPRGKSVTGGGELDLMI